MEDDATWRSFPAHRVSTGSNEIGRQIKKPNRLRSYRYVYQFASFYNILKDIWCASNRKVPYSWTMKKCKLSSTKSLKTRSVRKKHAKDGYSKQARCNARGVKGIFVANIQPYVSYVTENSAKHASRNTFQRHVEALPLATLQLDSQLNLSPSPSPNPSPPQQLLRNAFVEKNAERKSPLQPHINARQCYFRHVTKIYLKITAVCVIRVDKRIVSFICGSACNANHLYVYLACVKKFTNASTVHT